MARLFWTCLIVLLAAQTIHGLVWSLVLGNPVIDAGEDDRRDEDTSSSQEDDSPVRDHPRNTRFKLQAASATSPSGSRPTRQHHGQVRRKIGIL